MGHKIHPSGLRLGITQEHRSKWFATSKTYPILLQEDFKIRTFIQKKYGAAGISDVLIARKADQLELELKTARPGVIVGRQGSGIEDLISTRRLVHIVRAFSIFKNKAKAIQVCINRFDDETKQSFMELYDKVDADFEMPDTNESVEKL